LVSPLWFLSDDLVTGAAEGDDRQPEGLAGAEESRGNAVIYFSNLANR
jgi:hypothetical protein